MMKTRQPNPKELPQKGDANSDTTENAKPPLARRLWSEWIKPVIIVLAVLSSFRSAVADWNDVPTGSMKPTILEGDRIFVNKLAYDLRVPFTSVVLAEWEGPERGDIITVDSPVDGTRLVKRVLAVPGDRIGMTHHRLVLNGEVLPYGAISADERRAFEDEIPTQAIVEREALGEKDHWVMKTPGYPAPPHFRTIEVPEGCYFIMGDNRTNSTDSRMFGFVKRDAIHGRVFGVAGSLDPKHHYWPRWDRFFRSLD